MYCVFVVFFVNVCFLLHERVCVLYIYKQDSCLIFQRTRAHAVCDGPCTKMYFDKIQSIHVQSSSFCFSNSYTSALTIRMRNDGLCTDTIRAIQRYFASFPFDLVVHAHQSGLQPKFSGLCTRTEQSHLEVFSIDRKGIGRYDSQEFFCRTKCHKQVAMWPWILGCVFPCQSGYFFPWPELLRVLHTMKQQLGFFFAEKYLVLFLFFQIQGLTGNGFQNFHAQDTILTIELKESWKILEIVMSIFRFAQIFMIIKVRFR